MPSLLQRWRGRLRARWPWLDSWTVAPVCAAGRCGGPILVHALSYHPRVIACRRWPHEQRPVYWLLEARHRLQVRREPELDEKVFTPTSFYEDGRSPFFVDDRLEEQAFAGSVARLDRSIRHESYRFYRTLALEYGRPGATAFVEKISLRLLPEHFAVFPDVRPIVLLRDPRDAVVSAAKFFARTEGHPYLDGDLDPLRNVVHGAFGRSFLRIAEVLREMERIGFAHLVVRYEELVAAPERALAAIERFLGIETRGAIGAMAAVIRAPPSAPAHVTSASALDSIGRWKRELPEPIRDEVLATLAPAVKALGYE
jgi:hypothetical protein